MWLAHCIPLWTSAYTLIFLSLVNWRARSFSFRLTDGLLIWPASAMLRRRVCTIWFSWFAVSATDLSSSTFDRFRYLLIWELLPKLLQPIQNWNTPFVIPQVDLTPGRWILWGSKLLWGLICHLILFWACECLCCIINFFGLELLGVASWRSRITF